MDPTRYSGTCYQAANWTHLGQTQGRGRDAPRHACRETKKDIYVYPLRRDWRQCLTQGHRQADRKKRYRNDLASSHTRSVGEAFITLWEHVVTILHEVAAEYDAQGRVRTRVFDAIVRQYRAVRPGRSYPRTSRKPESRWRPEKEKRNQRKKEGMSRALLKLSGSLVHDYATISDDSPSPNRASRARRAATSAGIS